MPVEGILELHSDRDQTEGLPNGRIAYTLNVCGSGLRLYGITSLYASVDNRLLEKRAGVVMGYAALSERQIAKGVELLSNLASDLNGGQQRSGTLVENATGKHRY